MSLFTLGKGKVVMAKLALASYFIFFCLYLLNGIIYPRNDRGHTGVFLYGVH